MRDERRSLSWIRLPSIRLALQLPLTALFLAAGCAEATPLPPAGLAPSTLDSARAKARDEAPPSAAQLEHLQQMTAAALASVPGGPDHAVDAANRTLAPYFFVEIEDGAVDPLPLKRTHAGVHIAGAVADVRVTQVYRNEGAKPIEAIYLFPASTRAAVYGMKMTVGQRVIQANIRERGAARKEYERARARGQTSALLEQQRPNVFQMSLANILPGDEVTVELAYVELIVPEEHVYELVYPTTVGPRYSNKKEREAASPVHADSFVKAPYLPAGAPAAHTFALDGIIESGVPFASLEAPSHKTLRINRSAPGRAEIQLPEGDDVGNRDFILRYTLEGDAIQSGLLLEPGQKENHFLVMMEPPARVQQNAIVPREYIFIVDVSGSMNGFPLETSKTLMRHLFGGLRPEDKFNILSFSGGHKLLAPFSIPATAENVAYAMRYTESWESNGGTELLPALKESLALPRQSDSARVVVVITDGFVDVEKETFELIRKSLGEANLFAFGIGSSVNRFLIEGMARAGQGEPFIVTAPAEAEKKAAAFQSYIRSPVLLGVRARFIGFDAYDLEPVALPDLFSERPIVIQGKYRGLPVGQVVVSGRAAGGAFEQTLDVAGAGRITQSSALDLLWARSRIARLSDLDGAHNESAHKDEITALGLSHSLMTAYTSFVAVDSAVRTDGTRSTTVKHPQPMPAGVSDDAVDGAGNEMGKYGQFNSLGAIGTLGTGAGGGGTGNALGGLGGAGYGLGTIGYGRGGGSGASYGIGRLAGRASTAPTVALGAAGVTGGMSKELILRIIRRHMNELRFEYEKALAKNPAIQGRMVIKFTINRDGLVTTAIVQSSTVGQPVLEQAIATAFRRWEFPKPIGGGVVIVSYPLELKL